MNTKLRETYYELEGDEEEGWSDWFPAMVPEDPKMSNFVKRRGPGYRNTDLAVFLADVKDRCGIYEWAATKNGFFAVVYVGSTCPRGACFHKMNKRIVGYTTNGNHKKELINDALRNGYELQVRFKRAEDEEEAMAMENELLSRYNYAWNIRNNAVRQILAV